jgi:outer membrane immunogenic protein
MLLRTALLASTFAVCAAAPAFAEPVYNWTGFYVGANAGYGGDKFTYPVHGTYTDNVLVEAIDGDGDSPTHFAGKATQNSSGFLGGGQVGYDYQVGNWVLGAVADIDATNIEGKIAANGMAVGEGSASAHLGSKIDYMGTVRARVGMPIADGRFMPFVTAGFAYGQVTSSAALSYTQTGGSPTSFSASRHMTRTGWTVGAGADYAVTERVRFGVEYLYTDLGTHPLLQGSFDTGMIANQFTDGDGTIAGKIGVKTTANVVRVTLSYRFGG